METTKIIIIIITVPVVQIVLKFVETTGTIGTAILTIIWKPGFGIQDIPEEEHSTVSQEWVRDSGKVMTELTTAKL